MDKYMLNLLKNTSYLYKIYTFTLHFMISYMHQLFMRIFMPF